ncbi:permease family-domain-containing protein [Cokeromyces recurvatus]|uniref:permease family-domain-containing protein n=1 Tax=Cokeromyces recurvatus TaxID=90255 RepID=UPI00221EFF03|nr:permease family-domain-containing protein [Cokeromyces recurvatus]KAI7906531.1 permease family-domain-containing protein [Cokeromyces recurvatus]
MDSKIEQSSIQDAETIPSTSQTQFEAYAPVDPPNLWKQFKSQVATKEGWWGDFDWKSMCLPTILQKQKTKAPFWGLNSRLPLGLALIMGFQHSLAMVSGVVTPILIMTGSGSTSLNLEMADQQYLLSAALITSALLSLIQITRFKIWRTGYYLGTGLLSVVGPNFASIPASAAVIKNMYSTGYCPTNVLSDGTIQYLPCPRAWGAILGTAMVCSFFEIGMSFLPPKTIRRLFPPIVSGTTILLIGCSVISTALKDWAGGSGGCVSRPATGYYSMCPNIDAPHPLPWGSPQFLGLGFLVFVTIILIENFGSAFMKSSQIVIGLIVGLIVAAACGYVDHSTIASAPAITFLWVKTFPITVYGPAVIPFLIVFLDNMLESIGDITASCDVSGVEVEGEPFQRRIQGGLLADGVNSFLAACMTISPLVTFAQNNGVIAMTRCANRIAGYCCCFFILIYGVFGKISSVFLAIPSPVLGGMNAFLFASVTVSGIRILAYLEWTRRERFIVTCSLALGMGVTLVPSWFTHVFSYSGDNAALKGLLSAVETIVDTGYCIGSLMAIFLNLVIPAEWGPETVKELEEKKKREREAIRDGFINNSINEEHDLDELSTSRTINP